MSTISKWVLGHILLRWVCWLFSSCLLMLTLSCCCTEWNMNVIGFTLHYWCHILDLVIAGVVRLRELFTLMFGLWASCRGFSVKEKFRNVRPELGLTVSATRGNGAASALIIKEVERSKSRIAFAARRQAQVDFHLCWRTLGLQHRNVQASACLLDLSN